MNILWKYWNVNILLSVSIHVVILQTLIATTTVSGSLVYITPPLGSLFLSLVQTWLGHRMCMALTNIVQLSPALIVMVLPITVNMLYACSMLMGLSTGLATGLCISYSGEVCEPKLRGSLTSALNVFYFGGYFLVTTLYAITKNWKKTLLYAVSVPMLNFLALIMVSDLVLEFTCTDCHTKTYYKVMSRNYRLISTSSPCVFVTSMYRNCTKTCCTYLGGRIGRLCL